MGIKLTDADEGLHTPGSQENWNESRYIDFWDPVTRVGGWFRMGQRPNANYAEMSASINLPDGRTAFFFERAKIAGNSLRAGDLEWEVVEPFREVRVRYHGDLMLIDDAWTLTDPKQVYQTAPRSRASIDLVCRSPGLDTVMGKDQDHIDLIFLPGQADFHYQNLCHTTGTVTVGDQTFTVDGRGAKDHSWGPRNWHAKIYLRWLICSVDDDNGFIVQRAVGPTKQCLSGHVIDKGEFRIVDSFVARHHYAGAPNYELLRTELTIRHGDRVIEATGTPRAWLPLRHRQTNEKGEPALLRIVKSPTDWTWSDGRTGQGMCEIHDLMVDGKPVGLHD